MTYRYQERRKELFLCLDSEKHETQYKKITKNHRQIQDCDLTPKHHTEINVFVSDHKFVKIKEIIFLSQKTITQSEKPRMRRIIFK